MAEMYRCSHQRLLPERQKTAVADNDVIVHANAERLCRTHDILGQIDIGARWAGIAGGMVVHQDHRSRTQFQRALDHFARIDRRVVDSATRLRLVREQVISIVEKQNAELLDSLAGQGDLEIIRQAFPIIEDGTIAQLRARKA